MNRAVEMGKSTRDANCRQLKIWFGKVNNLNDSSVLSVILELIRRMEMSEGLEKIE